MFTFCFTSVAIRRLRRAQTVRNITNAGTIVRSARGAVVLGLIGLIAAGVAQAAGPSRQSNPVGGTAHTGNLSNKLVVTNANQTSTSKQFDSTNLKVLNKLTTTSTNTTTGNNTKLGSNPTKITKPIDLGIGGNLSNSKISSKLPLNGKIGNGIAVGEPNGKGAKPFIDGKPLGMNGKMKLDNKFLKDHFIDFCHDKCFHDCFYTCPWWYCWNYPTWCPLYRYGCGYWYDVPVIEIREGVDLQLLAVRMIDAGDAQQNLGPAFRVWVRNNSHLTIAHPFNVLLLAAHGAQPTNDVPQSGVRVSAIEAGQVLPIDIRLPVEANMPGLPMLHVLVDSHREIAEVFEDNNGAVLNRADILPIENAVSTVSTQALISSKLMGSTAAVAEEGAN